VDKPRCLVLFLESCRSEKTRESYVFHLEKFLKWTKKDYESLLFLSKPELTDLLVDYVLYMKKRVSPNSLPCYFAGLFKFLDINDREYNKRKINSLFGEKVKRRGDRPITDQELNEMVRVASSEKAKALIHVLSATGCRPQGISELKLKDVEEMPDGCLSLNIYADSTHEFTTFLHRVAADSLKKYHAWRVAHGEKLTPDSLVFVASKKFASLPTKPLDTTTLARILVGVMDKAKIKRKKEGTRNYDLAVCGGMRKRFNTKLKRNPNISFAIGEMFMDHKTSLESHYLKPTREELFEEYKKAIPDLVFDDSERLRMKNEAQKLEITELQMKERENKKLIDDLEILKFKVERIEQSKEKNS